MRIDRAAFQLIALGGLLSAQPGLTQGDATAPRFKDPERPGAARFEPTARVRTNTLEEVIVYGEEDEWRLPDLGSTWRIQREELEREQDRGGRLQADFLPLYDPELAPRNPDMFLLNKEEERVGKIELFRFKFGSKPED